MLYNTKSRQNARPILSEIKNNKSGTISNTELKTWAYYWEKYYFWDTQKSVFSFENYESFVLKWYKVYMDFSSWAERPIVFAIISQRGGEFESRFDIFS